MTSDSNSDGEIDPERRTAIKSVGILGTAFTGLFGNQDKGLVPPDYLQDQNWKKGKTDCGYGRGKWCWKHGRGNDRKSGKGYERDHPHYDDDNHWRDNRKRWNDECPDEDPEDADDGSSRDPEEEQGGDPESPEEDVDQGPDEEPEEDSGEGPENEPDEPEDDTDEEPGGDSEEEQDEEPDDDLDEEPEGDTNEEPGEPEEPDDPDEDVDEEPDGDSEEDQDETDVASQIEMRIHEEVNAYRQSNGLDPLTFSDELAAVARDHSQDMNERDYFSHMSPEGDGPGDRLADAGIDCNSWAENIAYEFDPSFSEEDADSVAESIVNGWINSPGHRRNILGDYDEEGIGVDIRDDGRIMATQMFCSNS